MAESTLDIVIRLREEASKGIKAIRDAAAESEKGLKQIGKQGTDGLKQVGTAASTAGAAVRRNTIIFQNAARQTKAWKDEAARANKVLDEIRRKRFDATAASIGRVRTALRNTRNEVDEAARDFSVLQSTALRIAAIGAAIAAPFVLGTRAAAEFSIQIAEIGTLVDDAQVSNDELRETVTDLSNEFGQNRGDIARGLYQAISSGAQAGAEANEVLRVALITARGGVTSVASAVDGLSTIINAFGLEARDAERVADSLFATVRGGRTTVQELSGFLFQAAPLAATLGVEFTDLNAALQAVTLQGVPTRNAFTQIRAALQGIIRDTPELNKIFAEYGGAAAAIQNPTIGLQGALELVREAAGDSEGALIKLVGSIEGAQGILATTGDNTRFLTQALEDQANALGAAADAAAEVEEAFGVKLQTAGVRIANLFTELGQTIGPAIAALAESFGELAVLATEFLRASETAQGVVQLVAVLGSLVAVLGTLGFLLIGAQRGLTLFAIVGKELALQFGISTAAVTAFRTALGTLLRFLGPIGLAITGLVIAYELLTDTNDELQNEIDETIVKIGEQAKAFQDLDAAAQVELTIETEDVQSKIQQQLNILRAQRAAIEAEGVGFFSGLFGGNADEQLARLDAAIGLNEKSLEAAKKQAEEFNKELTSVDPGDVTLADAPRIERQLKLAEKAIEDAKQKSEELGVELREALGIGEEGSLASGIEAALNRGLSAFGLSNAQEIQEAIKGEDDKVAAANRTIAVLQLQQAEVKRLQQLEADRLASEAEAKQAADSIETLESQQKLQDALDKLVQARLQNEIKLQRETDRESVRLLDDQLRKKLISEAEYLAEREKIIKAANQQEDDLARIQIEALRRRQENAAAQIRLDPDIDEEEQGRQLATLFATTDAAIARLEGGIEQRAARLAATLAQIGRDINGATLDEIRQQYETFRTNIESEIEAIRTGIETGDISQSLGSQRIADLNAQLARGIRGDLIPAVEEYFRKTKDPEALRFLEELDTKWKQVEQRTDSFGAQLRTQVEGNLSTFFDTTLQNIDNVGEAFDQLIEDIGASIRRLIAQRLSQALLESLFGGEGSVLGRLFSDGGSAQAGAGGGYFTKAKGGGVMKLADGGGTVRGPGTSTSDSIPAMLSDGEYVMRAKAVDKYGLQFMEAINRGLAPGLKPARRLSVTKPKRVRFATGGLVGSAPTASEIAAGGAGGGAQSLTLAVDDQTANMLMRDVLEREFGRILRQR